MMSVAAYGSSAKERKHFKLALRNFMVAEQ